MGFLRGAGLVIIAVMLFVALILAGTFATISMSLKYENVQPKIHVIAEEIILENIGGQKIVNQLTPYLTTYCINHSEIIQNFNGYTFIFPCSVVSEGYESILDYSIDYLTKDFYYKDYDCTFTKCFEKDEIPLFLVSSYAQNYWKSLFYKCAVIILVLCFLAFLLANKKSNSFYLIGTLFIITSLIVLKLNKIGVFLSKIILTPITSVIAPKNSDEILATIIGMFFLESSKAFIWMFIIGLFLFTLGIFFSLTALGFKIKQKIEEIITKKKIEELEEKQKIFESKLNKNQNKSNQQKQKKR